MTRIEELTLRLVDGELSDEGAHELDGLLASDSEARRVFVSQLKIEGALRGSLRQPGLAGAVIERLRLGRKSRIVAGVMREIRPAVRPRSLSTARPWQGYVLAASVLLAAGVLTVRWRRSQPGPAPASSDLAPSFATLTAASGTVTVSRGAVKQTAAAGLALVPGDRIETAAGSGATLAYLGASRFVLNAEATFTLDGARSAATEEGSQQESLLHLDRGRLEAWVSPQPPGRTIAFVTPHARAIVFGTGFSLAVTAKATRLTVNEGKVIFVRLRDGRTIDVGASQHAQSDEGEPAIANPPPTPTAPPPRSAVVTVFSLDFEDGQTSASADGQTSASIEMGYPVEGPPRPGNRFALEGEFMSKGRTNVVKVTRDPPPLFHYSNTQVIAFDYWIGADMKDISILCWHTQRKVNFSYWLTSPVRETWGHAEIRVADLVPEKGPKEALQDGDSISNLYFRAGSFIAKPLLIDNIKLLDYPPDAVPTSSPGGREGKL